MILERTSGSKRSFLSELIRRAFSRRETFRVSQSAGPRRKRVQERGTVMEQRAVGEQRHEKNERKERRRV